MRILEPQRCRIGNARYLAHRSCRGDVDETSPPCALVSGRFLTWYGPAMVEAPQALLASLRAALARSEVAGTVAHLSQDLDQGGNAGSLRSV